MAPRRECSVPCSAAPCRAARPASRLGLLLWWKPFKPDDVARLTQLVAEGEMRPAIDSRYPLDDVVGALRQVNDGRARGKVLVTVAAE